MRAEEVDLEQFPAPHWHKKDGGSYIGSGSIVVMRDPDDDWINASIYRVQVHSKNQVTIQFDHPGRHGSDHRQDSIGTRARLVPWRSSTARIQPCLLPGSNTCRPAIPNTNLRAPSRARRSRLSKGRRPGFLSPPMPRVSSKANSFPPDQMTLLEGPFGEFTGYYAAERRPCPVMVVKAVHYRDDPILLGSPPMKPPRFHFGLSLRGAAIWDNLEVVGVTDVVGVWQHVSQLMTVVALKQRYAGHVKRAALIAAANSYLARLVVVVDDDIDPTNLSDVMWAITTRCEPSESVDIIRQGWSSAAPTREFLWKGNNAAKRRIRR